MILSHSGLGHTLNIDVYINAFYMPMFFFISGYFLNVKKYSISKFIVRKTKRLLVPYFIWGFIHLLIWLNMYMLKVVNLSEEPRTMLVGFLWDNNVHFPISGALWFISCLFIISIIAFLIIVKFGNIIYISLSIIIGVSGLYFHPFLPWSGNSALVSNLFYCFGYIAALSHKNKTVKKTYRLFLLIIGLSIFHICAYYNGYTNIRECNYGNTPILYFPIALFGIEAWSKTSNFLYQRNCKSLAYNLITWTGRYSMPFLCLNQLFLAIFKRVMPNNIAGQTAGAAVTLILINIFTSFLLRFDENRKIKVYSLLFGR